MLGYLLLTGTLPFDGNVVEILMAHINDPIEAPSKRRGEPVDEAFEVMILRAMAKDPAQRHGSAAAFRYELNTVMGMLDMGRRGRTAGAVKPDARESTLVSAFDRSRIPQALLSVDGRIVFANKGFARLLGQDGGLEGLSVTDTTLPGVIPGLLRALRTTHVEGKPLERRARVFRGDDLPALELMCWFCPLPLPGTEVHLMIRVTETDPKGREG